MIMIIIIINIYIYIYKSLSLFHIVSEKCKKIQLTSRSVTLHHVVHHHSADCRWVSVGKTLRIETFWLRFDTDLTVARYCTDSHGLHRIGAVLHLVALCGIHFCFLQLSSAFFCLCWRLWKTAAYQRMLLDSSKFDRQRPEWRKTTDVSPPFSASVQSQNVWVSCQLGSSNIIKPVSNC